MSTSAHLLALLGVLLRTALAANCWDDRFNYCNRNVAGGSWPQTKLTLVFPLAQLITNPLLLPKARAPPAPMRRGGGMLGCDLSVSMHFWRGLATSCTSCEPSGGSSLCLSFCRAKWRVSESQSNLTGIGKAGVLLSFMLLCEG